MKIEKNKIVFASVLVCVILFIISYAIMIMGNEEEPTINTNQIPIPKLEDEQKEYQSKIEALNDLKEERQTNAPSIYDERLLDSTGLYDPDLLDKEKMRIVDSIYREGRISYSDKTYRKPKIEVESKPVEKETDSLITESEIEIEAKALGLEHQLFFASKPLKNELNNLSKEIILYAIVDGYQTVKKDYRLQMLTTHDVEINNIKITKNTAIYGFVSFKPNRVLIDIESINHNPMKLKAYDYQDGSEGIYVENSFRAEASREVLDDITQDINITGVPQVKGVKTIFQRNNRSVKVTIADNYKLILKVQTE